VGEPIINEDELIGYIARKASEEHDILLNYDDIRIVIDLEMDFLKEKGLVEE